MDSDRATLGAWPRGIDRFRETSDETLEVTGRIPGIRGGSASVELAIRRVITTMREGVESIVLLNYGEGDL